MSSIFTKIIDGEIPGRFVWKDEKCVAFMDIQPASHGHLLVVPREEIDRWPELPMALAAHLFAVDSMAEYDPANALANVTAEELDADAEAVRTALRDLGHGEFVPEA